VSESTYYRSSDVRSVQTSFTSLPSIKPTARKRQGTRRTLLRLLRLLYYYYSTTTTLLLELYYNNYNNHHRHYHSPSQARAARLVLALAPALINHHCVSRKHRRRLFIPTFFTSSGINCRQRNAAGKPDRSSLSCRFHLISSHLISSHDS